jgi:hypothetical protein
MRLLCTTQAFLCSGSGCKSCKKPRVVISLEGFNYQLKMILLKKKCRHSQGNLCFTNQNGGQISSSFVDGSTRSVFSLRKRSKRNNYRMFARKSQSGNPIFRDPKCELLSWRHFIKTMNWHRSWVLIAKLGRNTAKMQQILCISATICHS